MVGTYAYGTTNNHKTTINQEQEQANDEDEIQQSQHTDNEVTQHEQNTTENIHTQHTPIPQYIDTPNIQQQTQTTPNTKQQTPGLHDPTVKHTTPQRHNTPQVTQRQNKLIQKPEQQPQTELQIYDTETDSDSDSDATQPQLTLTNYEKQTLSLEEQTSYLYWRGLIKFEGSLKRRYSLYPNQLYRHIKRKRYKNKTPCEAELKTIFEYITIKTENGNFFFFYTSYKQEEDFLRQKCRENDIQRMNNGTINDKT